MSKKKAQSITAILTLIATAIGYYMFLPAINIKSQGFWLFAIGIIGIASFLLVITYSISGDGYLKVTTRSTMVIGAIVAAFFLAQLSGSPVFRAKRYAQLISANITDHDFQDYQATLSNVPLLDKGSAMNIANRKMGGLQDVISQYEINDTEQITVRGEPYRVACLNHAGFFKWLSNRRTGTPGFIKVDMNTQEAKLVRVEGGIKYTKSDYFLRDLDVYLRLNYPTKMLWESTLELDEDDHPYWVTAVMDKTIGLFGGPEVTGAVVMDATTGDHTLYALEDKALKGPPKAITTFPKGMITGSIQGSQALEKMRVTSALS